MSSKPIFSLQIKGRPLISLPGDSRPWSLDVYGVHDNFSDAIEDPNGSPLGPPTMQTPAGDSGRYTPCLVPTLARLQGYDSDAGAWRRVEVNASGKQIVAVDGFVSVLPPAVAMTAGFVAIGASETLLLPADLNRRYARFEVPVGSVDVWVSPAGLGTAAVGSGIRLFPGVAYTLDQFRFNTAWTAIAAAGSVNVAYVEGVV